MLVIKKSDLSDAKQHIFIAIEEMRSNLPTTHEALIEWLRDYFETQKVGVFSRLIVAMGEGSFRDFVAETVIETGKYRRDEDGQVRPIPQA